MLLAWWREAPENLRSDQCYDLKGARSSSTCIEFGSDSSSVRDLPGSDVDVDVEEIERAFCESSELTKLCQPHLKVSDLRFQSNSELLRGISSQFITLAACQCGITILPAHTHNLSLHPRCANDRYRSAMVIYSISERFVTSFLPEVPRFASTIASTTLPLSHHTTMSSPANASASFLLSEGETQASLVVSRLQTAANIPKGGSKSKPPQRFLNPLYVLNSDRYIKLAGSCLGCYERPRDFFRALFILVNKHADELKLSHADIDDAKDASKGQHSDIRKLKTIWECLFAKMKPFPVNYPVAPENHKCPQRKLGDRRSQASSSTAPSTRTGTILQSSDRDANGPSGMSQNPSASSHALNTLEFKLYRPLLPRDPGPKTPPSRARDAKSNAQSDRIHGINQYLLHLHKRTHTESWSINHFYKISVLGDAIRSIRSFLDFATDIMYMEPPDTQTVASFEDFSGWIPTTLPSSDHRDSAPEVYEDFIQVVDDCLQRFLLQAHGTIREAQHIWRSSVLDFAIQKLQDLLDEASRSMVMPQLPLPTIQSSAGDSNPFRSFNAMTEQSSSSSNVSQPSTDVCSNPVSTSTRSSNTIATVMDGDQQVITTEPKV